MQTTASSIAPFHRALLALALLSSIVGPALAQSAPAELEANKAVVRRAIDEVQRDGNFALFEQLYAASYVDHTPFPGFPRGNSSTDR